jgi:3-oxoacyl-[acyl-carrier-protein] synthase II
MRRLEPSRRVVITGIGVIAPNGHDLAGFWDSIRLGRSAGTEVTRFDAKNVPTRIAAEIQDFVPNDHMDAKTARRLDRSLQYAVAASQRAVSDAKLSIADMDSSRAGVVEATSVSNNETAFKAEEAYARRGYKGVSLFAMINGYSGGGSGEIALHLGIKGPSITCSTGSASGNDAMGFALRAIRNDEVDVMIAGGAEAPLLPSIWATFCQGQVMTRHNDDPKRAMRPFDQTRDGFLLGEGAAFFVFEELGHALSRGAHIYAEAAGHGRAAEAYHPVAPHPEGQGIVRAMESALRDAGMDISEIDYINAHGTATEANDVVETLAIQEVFGERARTISISSTKPITGHLMAAAGAVETAVTALAIYHHEIPLTLNLKVCDPKCTLDYVPDHSRPFPVRAAMNLSSGFGGKNSCLILKAYARRR